MKIADFYQKSLICIVLSAVFKKILKNLHKRIKSIKKYKNLRKSIKSFQKSITNKDITEFVIAPNDAIEIKLEMQKGSSVKYKWTTKSGWLNYNLHGD